MIEIKEFAFCFFASDINRVIEQEKEVTKLSGEYLIERWYRHDRNPGKYLSFSQMVNDAIDDTDSEFMIFCNPKTHFNSADIEFILEKLSNGYCFASVVNFGFFGCSKELIRRIGMMDERFIGGEWEDDDFCVRLAHFGKACWLEMNREKYEVYNTSRFETFRGITSSIFGIKYNFQDDKILIDENFFRHKKISKRHRKMAQPIYNSWLDSSHTWGNHKMASYFSQYKTELINPEVKEEIVDFRFKLNRENEGFRVELISDQKISIHFDLLSDIKTRHLIWRNTISNNEWKTMAIFCDEEIEIRLYMDDNQIYNSTLEKIDSLDLKFKLPKIIKTEI